MDHWHEALAAIRAQQAVHELALKALIKSHPQPGALLETWKVLRAEAVADAYAIPGHRHNEALGEHFQSYAEAWTHELSQVCGLPPP